MNNVIDLHKIKTTAENYYRDGDFYCSESIVKTIKDEFGLPISDDIVKSCFRLSSRYRWLWIACGAVAGGIITIGLFFGRSKPKDTKMKKGPWLYLKNCMIFSRIGISVYAAGF